MSTRPEAALPRLQRWLQDAILSAETVDGEAAARELRPSWSLAPAERLEIYRGMYEARLLEALSVDYPGLARYLGEDTFAALMTMYIRECPSTSYSLNPYGERLPEFLNDVEGLRRPRLVQDLARMERACTQVFDEEQSPEAGGAALSALPAEEWEWVRLRPIRALRLLALNYPVHLYLEALRDGREPPAIRARPAWVAVFRRDYAVMHLALTRQAFLVLRALAGGLPLGQALRAAGRVRSGDVSAWFQRWFSEKLFSAVEADSACPAPRE